MYGHESWLPELSSKLEVLFPSYRVVVHGVPTDFKFDTDGSREAALEAIVRENAYLGDPKYAVDKLENLQWMSRKSSPPPGKSYSSLVLFFKESASANNAIENGIALNGRLLRAERFRSLPTQCYNCHHFGHIARYCKNRPSCGHCAGPHATTTCRCPSENACVDLSQCNHIPPKCTLCKGPHRASSRDCPVRADVPTPGHLQFGRFYYVPEST